MSGRYGFLVETYATERLKTLSVWSQFADKELSFRPEPPARTPHEQMVHQCVGEDVWMRTMLGIDLGEPALPAGESRLEPRARLARRHSGVGTPAPRAAAPVHDRCYGTRVTV